ncbi:MAG: hypothetical protein ACREIC_23335, partial [Limisphaerales bacterium]
SRSASKGLSVNIYLNSNGIPTLLGIPLGTGSVLDFLLRTLHRTKVPVHVLTPSGGSGLTGFDTNWIRTMNAVIKAGLIPTNGPSGPSPYE